MDRTYFDSMTGVPRSQNFLLGDTSGALVSIISLLAPEAYDKNLDRYTYKLGHLTIIVRFDDDYDPDTEMARSAVILNVY